MTFSLLGRCGRTGRLGMVISSSSPAVAARCAHARPGVGVAASQNVTDPRLGPALLDALARGADARAALDAVVAGTAHIAHRQLAVLGTSGEGAAYTGAAALGTHGSRSGTDCVAAGNLLADTDVLGAMTAAFADHPERELGDRLIGGLRAGASAGGEAGPVHSAGLLMTGDVEWPIADLRIDWHDEDPVGELARVWEIYKPQLEDYIARALNPGGAPGYGVPGE
ncbi:MAG TPA: DUF1028 domain-containing protein [Solirubrobacteraceae bacterium]|nr:DUF1028 domain-containing protein [Solirubrobacteraceae bacterium]